MLLLAVVVPVCLLAAGRVGVSGGMLSDVDDPTSDASPTPVLDVPSGFDPYLYRMNGEQADPVNVIFLHTDAATAAAVVERVLGWRPVVASGMLFKTRTSSRPTSRQLSADVSPVMRYHMRLEAVPITDTQTYVLASVHRDETAACGHVGRGFNEMREVVAQGFAAAGFAIAVIDLGNTNQGLHCDGSHVGGDGRVVLIDLSATPRVDGPSTNRVSGAN